MESTVRPGWMPEYSVVLDAVASVDPRPDTVEDVLNVCPHQAARFREWNDAVTNCNLCVVLDREQVQLPGAQRSYMRMHLMFTYTSPHPLY